jgi:hypothetical protein
MPSKARPQLQCLIDDFVKQAGGELVTDLIDERNPPSNADYFFREQNVIVELKALESDTFGHPYKRRLGELVASWVARGLIAPYGTSVPLRINEIPPECQKQWNALTRRSMQSKVFAKANGQINATKRLLGKATAKGVLLLASDGNKGPPTWQCLVPSRSDPGQEAPGRLTPVLPHQRHGLLHSANTGVGA